MYLSQLKLWNFRKYGGGGDIVNKENKIRSPDLEVNFKEGLNVLIGENDSGKTTIIDAIKLTLKTHSSEWIRVNFEDFYQNTKQLRIECFFLGLSETESSHFVEWLGMDKSDNIHYPFLKLILEVEHNGDRIKPFEVRAGADDRGNSLSAEARDYLKTTYLRPLRDAQNELIPKRNSRLSQILEGHEAFKEKKEDHKLKDISRCFNCLVQKYFNNSYYSPDCDISEKSMQCPFVKKFFNAMTKQDGDNIRENLNNYLHAFLGNNGIQTRFEVTPQKLRNILEILKLSFDEEFESGLGSQNLLFMASELLNLDRNNWSGLRLGLIEELEAHLHPQAQLRIISFLQNYIQQKRNDERSIQLILTTHSPNLGSKVDLENLLICSGDSVFPMGRQYTKLKEEDYSFLQRFLDVTKANLFFATGVILVEGFSEELILPVLAKKIGYDLVENGVSIVNVGGIVFLRYSKIFQRTDNKELKIPVSIITDLDLKQEEVNLKEGNQVEEKKDTILEKYEGQSVKAFVLPQQTLEYCLASSKLLRKIFYTSVLLAFKEHKDFQTNKKVEKIDSMIEKIDLSFNVWSDKDIPETIYQQISGEAKIPDFGITKISKPTIAHFFADLLGKDDAINKESLEKGNDIKYLIDAIKYASGEKNDDPGN